MPRCGVDPLGSGVTLKSRLWRYSRSRLDDRPPAVTMDARAEGVRITDPSIRAGLVARLGGIVQPHEGDQKHHSVLTKTIVAIQVHHDRVERSAVTARSRRARSARHGTQCLIAALVALALRGQAIAGEPPPIHLALPLLTTLALGRSALDVANGDKSVGFRARARAALGLLPSALHVPDRYAVDVTDRDPARFAAPIDRTTYASFNLLPRRFSGRSLSLLYATEGVPAMRKTSPLFGLKLSVDF